MITTARSVAVGLAAWLLAFVIACLGKLNPAHPSALGILVFVFSVIIGFLAVVALGRRFCRYSQERGNAVMIFSLAYSTAIFAPMAAIWANAQFYDWAAKQQTRPKSFILAPMIAVAMERTSISFYLGMAVLVTLGLLVARRVSAATEVGPTKRERSPWSLGWHDAMSSLLLFLLGLSLAVMWLTSLAEWIAYTGLAFLVALLIRSLRIQAVRLQVQIPSVKDASIATSFQRLALMGQFAIRCGVWTGLAATLLVGGLVLKGIAEVELIKAATIPTPFALTVHSMMPLFCIAAGPSLGVALAPFAILAGLPRGARFRERIMVCAQGGATAGLVPAVSLIAHALGLATCLVVALPSGNQSELRTPVLQRLLIEGHWIPLAGKYLMFFVGSIAVGTALWTLLAVIGCAFGTLWAALSRTPRSA